jgi:diacylglycerol kinase
LSAIQDFIHSRARSFRHAFAGLDYALRTQPNTWIHTVFSLAVIIVCIWLQLTPRDWAIIVVAITLVWAAELFNTSIEAIVDLASPNHHPHAKAGKDAAAGAVLVTAIGAILVGLLIIGPPLWEKVQSLIH